MIRGVEERRGDRQAFNAFNVMRLFVMAWAQEYNNRPWTEEMPSDYVQKLEDRWNYLVTPV